MSILVAGLINIETTLRVDAFPVDYQPVRYPFHGVHTTVSGVGCNIAVALATLGEHVQLLSLVGHDAPGQLVRPALAAAGTAGRLDASGVCASLAATPQSVILFDGAGRRQIHVDLKDIQEQTYPAEAAAVGLAACDAAVLCNINFARPLLRQARQAGKLVVTDVHAIADLDDTYNRDFMAAADIVFMSHEHLPEAPEAWARRVIERYGTEIVVIGLGAQGAVLAVKRDGRAERFPAVVTRPVVNTIGAGDALLAAFVHAYAGAAGRRDPYAALRRALVFASHKCGANGGAEGFLTAAELEELVISHQSSLITDN
jgi:sugar/nucleoside kinase (ribokinase family)